MYNLAPHYKTHLESIDSILKKNLQFVKFRLPSNINCSLELMLSYLHLSTFCTRKTYFSICFIYKLLNNLIDVPDLLNMIKFRVPQHLTRIKSLFYIDFAVTNYVKASPLHEILNVSNLYYNEIDFFCYSSFNSFKHKLRILLLM